jgi:hypothetical protein
MVYFCLWPFYKSFVCFQFSPSITIRHIFFFSIWSLFFWFLILTLGSFVKVLIVFYFVIQSKFMLSFFNLALILLIFFVEVFSFFFQFNRPIYFYFVKNALKKSKLTRANLLDLWPGSWGRGDPIKSKPGKTKKQDSSTNKYWGIKLRKKSQ